MERTMKLTMTPLRKLSTAAAVAIFAMMSAPTFAQAPTVAQIFSAGELASECEHSAATIGDLKTVDANDGSCSGRIMGWRNVIDELPVFTPDRRSQIHIEATATNGQLIRVFVAYVKAHPEVENKEALLIFSSALRDAGLLTITAP